MRMNYVTPKALCLVMAEPLMQSASISYTDSKVDNGRPMLSRRRRCSTDYDDAEYWEEEDSEMDF